MAGSGKNKSKKGTGARQLHTRVKTAKGRKLSSTLWLERHLNDPFVAQAKADGWRSRAAFKLLEMDDKHKLLKPGKMVVDLGCAPGGWSQVAAKRTKSGDENPTVIGLDLLEMDGIPGVKFLQQDFTEEIALNELHEALGKRPVDLVMSDMAAATTGHRQTDHLRTINLCELALDFAIQVSATGASFIAKVLRGGTENDLLAIMKQHYKSVAHIKPAASRQESVELYVLAKGFKG